MLAAMAEAISIQLSDGTELWATVRGTGQPVAFVHGGPGLWNYLDELAALVEDVATVIGFDQRGCGRSGGSDGPFTIAQAVTDLDELRAALWFDRWVLVGHSWGAELALRYAARHPDRATAVVYIAGVGAGDGFRDSYVRERERRLGPGLPRFTELTAIPANERAPDEEQERCLLLWETDFAPGESAAEHALALWRTRPPGAVVNMTANHLKGPSERGPPTSRRQGALPGQDDLRKRRPASLDRQQLCVRSAPQRDESGARRCRPLSLGRTARRGPRGPACSHPTGITSAAPSPAAARRHAIVQFETAPERER